MTNKKQKKIEEQLDKLTSKQCKVMYNITDARISLARIKNQTPAMEKTASELNKIRGRLLRHFVKLNS